MTSQSLWHPLGHPTFRAMWLATISSNLGNLLQAVGAAWLMATLTSSQGLVSLVQSASYFPVLCLTLIAGAAADLADRRRIILMAQIGICVSSAVLAAGTIAGLITPALVLAFTVIIGAFGAFNQPAWNSSIPDMVPREDVATAISLNNLSFNVMRCIGPAVGGTLVAFAGASTAFALNAVATLPLTLVSWRWLRARRTGAPPPANRPPLLRAVADGIGYARRTPWLVNIAARGMGYYFAASALLSQMPLLARDVFTGTAMTYGLLLCSFGAGAICASFVNRRLNQRFGPDQLSRLACFATAAAAAILALSDQLALSMAGLFAGGMSWVVAGSLFNVYVQLSAPRQVLGRALSICQMGNAVGIVAGAALWGLSAEVLGLSISFLLAALAAMSAGLLSWLRPLRADAPPDA